MTINGKVMDMARIDEVVTARARETWVVESTGYIHNLHIHGVQFRLLDIDGEQPPPHLRGSKDTVYLPEGSKARLAVEFARYTDPGMPYMYHCHVLRHEDMRMMGQFLVVSPGSEEGTSRSEVPPLGGSG
ncbi:multicopper oxidase domain-containing protein [Streptomyces scopuliridis]|uniref:multicopper oxidase domain-containing protein n=1 Tax=Streptomyces scopuliridis TaxID=452529 RepID=UPI0036A28811